MASNSTKCVNKLINLKFDNLALKMLPVDKSMVPGSRKVTGACFSLVNPTLIENPKLVAMSSSAMKLLDIDETNSNKEDLAEYFSGNKQLPGSVTAAHCYCGHQFGAFSGQLGDGAAMYLGEITNQNNEKWEIQIKGAGPTPFSRSSDGRKVLRSSIREFLCSEAMHHLGIPTTRAGTIVTSDSLIVRDMFYDGRPRREKCTVVLRIAPTFLRFGSFEIFKPEDSMTGRSGPSVGQSDLLKKMLDYSISTFYPHINDMKFDSDQDRYLKFYQEVCLRTAEMVAKWQTVGFCHGVLNTDNMSILGITIDYGPFGFLDRYDPDFVCNHSDDSGRYSFRKQPEICHWNLKKFAEALQMLLPLEKSVPVLNEVYYHKFNSVYFDAMRKKLGLITRKFPEDEKLVQDLLNTMEDTYSDYTNTLRSLSVLSLPGVVDDGDEKLLESLLRACADVETVKASAKPSFAAEQLQALKAMAEQNPQFLNLIGGMNGPIKRELEKAEKFETIDKLTPDSLHSSNSEKWRVWIGQYKLRLDKEVESCADIQSLNNERKKVMDSNNPKYILRNYLAQNAIDEAEKDNFLEVRNVLRRLHDPYDLENEKNDVNTPQFGFNNAVYDAPPPLETMSLRVS